jgi:hypothetical protein
MVKTNHDKNSSGEKQSPSTDMNTISNKRSQLYRNIAQLIAKQSNQKKSKKITKERRAGEPKSSVLLDVLDAFKGDVQEVARIELATEIASMVNPPLDLAEKLAMDTLKVSAPIIKKVAFNDEALLRIIDTTGRQHHILIAERGNLSKDLWKAIARNRMKNAIGNKRVVISRNQVKTEDAKIAEPEAMQEKTDEEQIQAEKDKALFKLAKQIYDGETPLSNTLTSDKPLSDWDIPQSGMNEPGQNDPAPSDPAMANPFDDAHINEAPVDKINPYTPNAPDDPFIHDNERVPQSFEEQNPVNTHPGRRETTAPLHTMIREMESTASLVDAILDEGRTSAISNSGPVVETQVDDPFRENISHGDSWTFTTNRLGDIDNISANATKAFGLQPFELRGENLFDTLIIDAQGDGIRTFEELISKNHPLRDIHFKLLCPETANNSPTRPQFSQWLMRAKARFDPLNGKFTGYEGTAFPHIIPEPYDEYENHPTGDFEDSESISNALTAKIVSTLQAKSVKPVRTLIATAVKLAQMAQTKSDRALLNDALNVLESTKELKEMIEDSDSLLMTLQGRNEFDRESFTLGIALEEILSLDAMKEGHAARFYIDPAAMNTTVNFNLALFLRAMARMINVARMFGSRQGDRIITAQPGLSGLLEIRVPLGKGSPPWKNSDILFDPIAALQGKIDQNSPAQSAYHVAFGLSSLQKPIQSLGGNITIISGQDETHWLMLEVKTLL